MRGDGPLIIDDIDRHWWYDKDNYPPQAHPFELIQNPEMVYEKGYLKGAIGVTASKRFEKSTERDSSQYELTNSAISGDKSNLKGIHSVPKKGGRPKGSKIAPKAKAKPMSPLKKQKRKDMEVEIQEEAMIRIANRPRKRFEIDSDSDEAPIEISSDDNNEVDEENETEENEIEENEIEESEIEENEIEKSETEKEAEIEMR